MKRISSISVSHSSFGGDKTYVIFYPEGKDYTHGHYRRNLGITSRRCLEYLMRTHHHHVSIGADYISVRIYNRPRRGNDV